MNSSEKLKKNNDKWKFICIGLDSDINKIPHILLKNPHPLVEFNKSIIEATKDYAAAYKINFAFYEVYGSEGLDIIKETLSFIPEDILTIGDAKRGDIGNTSSMYAKSLFDYFNFDSITVNPYMGEDSVTPFLNYKEKLVFILALTSNPGANDFEKLQLKEGGYLFQKVINKIKVWNYNKNCGMVFGATNNLELTDNIHLFGDLPVLLPGVGAQGGDLNEVLTAFKSAQRGNFIVNIGRAIIYKDDTKSFAETAKEEIILLNDTIRRFFIE
jgi:orotidine-5'-phosphate decarboxylase